MSHSPMTPSKQGLDRGPASPLTQSSGEKKSRFAKHRLTSFMEPSPASTYGETIASSVPATPLEATNHGTSCMARTPSVDPAIKNLSISPFIVSDTKHRLSIISSTRSGYSGEDNSVSPHKRGTQAENTSGSTTSSPAGLVKSLRSAPTWRGEQETKRLMVGQSDDPFVSAHEPAPEGSHGDTVLMGQNPHKVGLAPSNNTAQAIFPPQACVFVANLSQSETDEQLEHAVTEAFQQFGDVYVKIRRDSRQMPFAFAQYTNVNDAQRAISLGRGMIVSGRPCRTEVARVNRSLYLSKINGGIITETEARDIMDGQGNIETIWYASQTERELFGLPEGVFIRFAFFDDCRDVITKFRESSLYRLEQVKGLEDSRSASLRGSSSLFSTFRRGTFDQPTSPYAARQHLDKFSVFVGNLPPYLTQDQLASMFQGYGRIVHIEMIRKPSIASSSGVNTFAFIEFDHPQSATAAVQAGSRLFQGLHLRIEHKEPAHTGHRGNITNKGSPRSNYGVDSPDFLAAFQRGVSIGMTQAVQSIVPGPYFGQYPYFQLYDQANHQSGILGSSLKDGPAAHSQNPSGNFPSAPMDHHGNGVAAVPYGQFEQLPSYTAPETVSSQLQWPTTPYDDSSVTPLHPL